MNIKKVPYLLYEDEDGKLLVAFSIILHVSPVPKCDVLIPKNIIIKKDYPHYFFYDVTGISARLVAEALLDYFKAHTFFCEVHLDEPGFLC